MKSLFYLFIALLFVQPIIAQQAGSLDVSFGDDGVVISDIHPELAQAFLPTIHIQTDGKIVAPGYYTPYGGENSNRGIAVCRYESNGDLDLSFGHNGITRIANYELSNTITNPFIRTSTITADDHLIVSGMFTSSSGAGLLVVKFKPNGDLDSTYGIDGIMKLDLGLGSTNPTKIIMSDQGRLIVAGKSSGSPGFVLRLLPNGGLDSSFATNGVVYLDQVVESMGIDLFGRILCFGEYSPQNQWGHFVAVTRLLADGSLDSSFGIDGIASFDLSETSDINDSPSRARALHVYTNGDMLIGGGWYNVSDNNTEYFICKVKRTGQLDSAFAVNGVLKFNPSEDFEATQAILIQADGKIIGIGETLNSGNQVFRLNIDGSFDSDFGENGMVQFPFRDSGNDQTTCGALQSDQKVLVGGITRNPENGHETEFAIARILTDLNIGIVELTESLSNTLVYPNPIEEQARLQFELTQSEELTISLVDMQGRLVQTFISEQEMNQGKHDLQLHFSKSLESGAYLLSVSSKKGQMGIQVIKR
ncbi:MAG: T9SS type A sorting domain-containing protein [Flavobacteriales bacterium]|nr:T9SS type A sorting domain-containing protein [Flavobacteriales bacterium]